ncbi:MAG TPA: ABC transporter permease [Agriterribacter sp.]|nr:ABC transporter permease [Agriterribacter sp.]
MFSNFLKSTIRNFSTNKGYSLLNVFGLATGIACAALIFLWVENEMNYDKANLKKDQLYAVRVNESYSAGIFTHWSTPGLLGPAIKAGIPGIANTCRKSEGNTNMLFTVDDKPMYAAGIYAEPSLFSMFTLPFVQGNANSAFSQLYSIVITEKTAKKFFGSDTHVIGKTVRMDNRQDYVVTGVLKDLPQTSSLQFEWVVPFEIYFQQSDWLHKWSNNSITTYVELNQKANVSTVNKELRDYIQKHVPASISHLVLFGMNDWHLYDEFENGALTGGGRIEYVRMFSVIAWIILLIACINFMNMSTARSEKRAREVGVRKVLGAGKKGLVFQFMGEAFFMAVMSAIIAVVIVLFTLPAFNTLVQQKLSLHLGSPVHMLFLLAITLLCGLISGSYPALYLSSFNPTSVLKGLKSKTGSAAFVRKGLVVLQFTISIILIISTIIVYQQIQHVKSRQLGFNKNNLVEINVRGDMKKNFSFIKQDLLATGVVDNAAISDHETIYGGNNTDGMTWQGKAPGDKILISFRSVSPEYMNTSGMQILEGRDFFPGDSIGNEKGINVLVTESLAKLMTKESAIGKTLHQEGDTAMATVVGVVNDYVYGDMYGKPDPVIFICMQPEYTASVMYVRIKPQARTALALAKIEAVMKKDNPVYPFDYRFVDDQFSAMFQNEMFISKLSRVFAALAIIISCLGLFALAAYTAERRTKEIGIRKVLGASVSGITNLLSKDFLQLVVLSCLVAFPIAWATMHHWLQDYQYRVNINWWVFIAAGVVAIIIALVTVSFHAIKAAIANPVKSLRTE